MHNRMWAAENVYAKQNGGAYDFDVETANNLAIPLSQVFWDDLLANNSYINVYEQDWMCAWRTEPRRAAVVSLARAPRSL
jgi:hypothetical protein